MATIGAVTYPTDTTWQVEITGVSSSQTFTVSDGTESIQVTVTAVPGPHTLRAVATAPDNAAVWGAGTAHWDESYWYGGVAIATVVPGADLPAASGTLTAALVGIKTTRSLPGASATGEAGSITIRVTNVPVPLPGASATGEAGVIGWIRADGVAQLYADLSRVSRKLAGNVPGARHPLFPDSIPASRRLA